MVLDDLSVTMEARDITLVAGRTGQGKSTFLYLAAGLYPHYAGVLKRGSITVDNEDLSQVDPSQRCRIASMMFQNPDLQFCMDTVRNEMVFCLENIRQDVSNFEKRIDEALSFCNIQHLRERKLITLSGGEKQKVALACIWLLHPRWLLLDEPFASIDQASRTFLIDRLAQMHAEYGTGIVTVDHHPENWRGVANAYYQLDHGKLERKSFEDIMPAALSAQRTAGTCMSEEISLEMKDVSIWHDNPSHPVLKNINLSFRQGGSYAILGESGSGKSTLFGAVFGLYPYSGTICLRQSDLKKRRRHLRGEIGIITQNPQDQFIGGTVSNEISAAFVGEKGADEKTETILKSIGLWKYRDVSPYLLSQGQQRRLGAAAMMNSHCQLLLCDEPTCAQDAQSAEIIMTNLLHQARERNITIVFSTHEQDIATTFADEIWIIRGQTLVRVK